MNKDNLFRLVKTESSFCPSCQKNVWLLYSDSFFGNSIPPDSKSDAFYICFSCEFVGQIGVGKVEVENDSI